MLNKDHITNIPMLSDEWFQNRLGCFTSSEMYCFMGEKPFTTGAMSYIKRKVYEELSGLPAKEEVDTKATEHGKKYESEGIVEFGRIKELEFVVTQKLIKEKDSRFGSTPDFLILHNESIDKKFWNVSTGEIKCPLGEAFIGLAMCKTPLEIKKEEVKYFWQVISQMDMADSLVGYIGIFNPFVKVGKMNIVEFRKKDLIQEFKLLNERKILAVQKFEEIRDFFLNK